MGRLSTSFNWGSEIRNLNRSLFNQLSDAYASIANVMNTKPSTNITTTDPQADVPANLQYLEGDMWVNKATDNAWIMTSRTTGTAVTWKIIT